MPDEAFLTLAPDWVAEILSPSTARLNRLQKLAIYARERVPHVWLLDPAAQVLEVLVLEQGRWVVRGTFGADEHIRAVPFDAIEIDLAQVWGEREPGR